MQRWLIVVCVLAVAAVLAWRWAPHPGRDDSLQRVQAGAALRVGYAVEAPYALVQADGGVTGAAPELARLVGERLGVRQFVWIQTHFDALIPELLARRFDVVAAGMFITPERAERVAHSRPTQKVRAGLLVRAPTEETAKATGAIDELARVAVIEGSVEHIRWVRAGWPADRLMLVPDAAAGRSAVLEGLADALALSLPTVRWMAAHSNGKLSARAMGSGQAWTEEADFTAFQFHPQDVALREAWDEALAAVIGSPAHLEAVRPWGFGLEELPGSLSVREVLVR
ncbi:MAG: transporter substrate-binding domain-containing protein [Caldimonas sp.]|uniref:transporter substrate-binding domain-containing protein n=1 Tax=Caldimonas sp. TaxID=2838790 RepID=UPI00391CC3D5